MFAHRVMNGCCEVYIHQTKETEEHLRIPAEKNSFSKMFQKQKQRLTKIQNALQKNAAENFRIAFEIFWENLRHNIGMVQISIEMFCGRPADCDKISWTDSLNEWACDWLS